MRRLLPTCFLVVLLVGRYQILCVLKALPLQALKHAIWNAKSTVGLVHHLDHGSQYVSLAYDQHLVDAGIVEST
ncbi:hypothetical protein [Arcanobacterium phocae]|uniref:hypothetical protein n=1 Tax=Arcanobacterium phocae TaxID=131112 RepID=UPI001C0EC641|nr:hypothetical protein [Arcanobacterium phocae]